jgi:hypothetical protein
MLRERFGGLVHQASEGLWQEMTLLSKELSGQQLSYPYTEMSDEKVMVDEIQEYVILTSLWAA